MATKLPDMGCTAVSSPRPVCCGQPTAGDRAMCTVSTRSFTRAMDAPTAPVANRVTSISAARMMTVRRRRRRRTR